MQAELVVEELEKLSALEDNVLGTADDSQSISLDSDDNERLLSFLQQEVGRRPQPTSCCRSGHQESTGEPSN